MELQNYTEVVLRKALLNKEKSGQMIVDTKTKVHQGPKAIHL